MHKSSQKFFLMYPALEPESCLFDENHIENPQAYVEKWKAQDNKLEIRLLEFNTVKAEFVLQKKLEINYTYSEIYFEETYVILLVVAKEFYGCKIWAMVEGIELKKLHEIGGVYSQNKEGGNGNEKPSFEFDFIKT